MKNNTFGLFYSLIVTRAASTLPRKHDMYSAFVFLTFSQRRLIKYRGFAKDMINTLCATPVKNRNFAENNDLIPIVHSFRGRERDSAGPSSGKLDKL